MRPTGVLSNAYKAGGVDVNLTGTDYVLHLDPLVESGEPHEAPPFFANEDRCSVSASTLKRASRSPSMRHLHERVHLFGLRRLLLCRVRRPVPRFFDNRSGRRATGGDSLAIASARMRADCSRSPSSLGSRAAWKRSSPASQRCEAFASDSATFTALTSSYASASHPSASIACLLSVNYFAPSATTISPHRG